MCVTRWPWTVLATRRRPVWTNWWRGSSTAVVSPAVRKVARRGRWCSSIQQTTAWTPPLYWTARAELSLTHSFTQTYTPTSTRTRTRTQTITHCHTHPPAGDGVRWSPPLFPPPPHTHKHSIMCSGLLFVVKALWKRHTLPYLCACTQPHTHTHTTVMLSDLTQTHTLLYIHSHKHTSSCSFLFSWMNTRNVCVNLCVILIRRTFIILAFYC